MNSIVEVIDVMTALSVRVPEQKRGLRGLAERLRGDRVEVKTCRARGVTLRHVIYTSYSGTVRLEKADEAVGIQRDRLLCSDKIEFPPRSGYKRFRSTAFAARLCTNFALGVIKNCRGAARLCTAIYDPNAYNVDCLPHIAEYCGDVRVVTDCREPYLRAAEQVLEELGAAVLVTRRREELCGCRFIIAPQPVAVELPLPPDAVTLTVCAPARPLNGTVLWRYRFPAPNGFADIKPKELSEEYFCSALYTLGAQYELGSIVPLSAHGRTDGFDVKSLANLLDKRK